MAAMSKLIIEVRMNEYAGRNENRHVPWTPQEIAAVATDCREAGAAIAHFHPRTAEGGIDFNYETYRDIVTRIKAQSDVLVHPTIGAFERAASAEDRLANIVQLAKDGLRPDFSPLDMGSSNADVLDLKTGRFESLSGVYVNTNETLKYFAETLRGIGVKPYLVIWNLTMLRPVEIFHRMGVLDGPLFLSFGLSPVALSLHPPTLQGLQTYLNFLPKGVRSEWSVTLYGGSLLTLAGAIISSGGHIAIGLGDYAYPELGQLTNADLIRRIALIAKECGREIATPDEAREILGVAKVR